MGSSTLRRSRMSRDQRSFWFQVLHVGSCRPNIALQSSVPPENSHFEVWHPASIISTRGRAFRTRHGSTPTSCRHSKDAVSLYPSNPESVRALACDSFSAKTEGAYRQTNGPGRRLCERL